MPFVLDSSFRVSRRAKWGGYMRHMMQGHVGIAHKLCATRPPVHLQRPHVLHARDGGVAPPPPPPPMPPHPSPTQPHICMHRPACRLQGASANSQHKAAAQQQTISTASTFPICFASQQFHAMFDSPPKVLFTYPAKYMCAINPRNQSDLQ